ncbi:hypothetical protein Tco_0373017, partial [Tanacetum coccineum]
VARKVQEDWEAEEEVKKLVEEEATKAALSNEYDFIQARLNANKILAKKLKEEEKEDTTKAPAEQEVTEKGTKKRKSGHLKMIARKRPRPQPDDDSDDEHRKCLRIGLHLRVP